MLVHLIILIFSGASRDLEGISLHLAVVGGMPFVVGASVEARGAGETGGGWKGMVVDLGGTGLEGRSVKPDNSGYEEMRGWVIVALTSGC